MNENLLIEQYKLYVDSAQKISEARNQTNKFFISVLSVIITLVALFIENVDKTYKSICTLVIGIFGLVLCMIWASSILSYKKLNAAKFVVIHEIEKNLPIACFEKEWEIVQKSSNKHKRTLTKVEIKLPVILAIPFIAIVIISIISMC